MFGYPLTVMFVYPPYPSFRPVVLRVNFFENFKNYKKVVFDLPTNPKGYFGPTNPPQAPPTGFQRYLSTFHPQAGVK